MNDPEHEGDARVEHRVQSAGVTTVDIDRPPGDAPARPSRREQVATAGIIGGLGPLAHIIFEQRLLAESTRRGATRDADHPVWLLVNATDVPDRTQSIAGQAQSCSRALIRHGRMLHAAGADFLIVTCNTAHAFHPEVQDRLGLPWINLINRTAESLVLDHPGARKVGVLATDGTLSTGLYQTRLTEMGLIPIVPELGSELQQRVMDAIYAPGWGIKGGGPVLSRRARQAVLSAIDSLAARGAEVLIAGCTELSVVLDRLPSHLQPALPHVDPLDIAAKLVLDLSFKSTGKQPALALMQSDQSIETKAQ